MGFEGLNLGLFFCGVRVSINLGVRVISVRNYWKIRVFCFDLVNGLFFRLRGVKRFLFFVRKQKGFLCSGFPEFKKIKKLF